MHISLHQFCNDVDIFVASAGWWLGNIYHLDDVLMVKELQQLDLSHNSLSIDEVLEGLWNLLDGYFDLVFVIIGTAHHTISSMSNLFNVFKFLLNTESCA